MFAMAPAKFDDLTPVQRLVSEAVERLERAHKGARKFSLRPLELQHGIPNGTIGRLIKGQSRTVQVPTAKKIAALLGIPWEPLAGSELPTPGTEPTPPPATTVRLVVVDDGAEQLIDEAFDGTRHKPSDAVAVREILARRAALLEDGADAVAIVRDWLDAAARLRERGKERPPEAIFSEVSRQSVERQRQLNERARAESSARGYEPPAEVPAPLRGLGKKPKPAE